MCPRCLLCVGLRTGEAHSDGPGRTPAPVFIPVGNTEWPHARVAWALLYDEEEKDAEVVGGDKFLWERGHF